MVVERFLKQHPASGVLPITLVAPSTDASDSQCTALGQRLDASAEAFRAGLEEKFGAAARLIAERRRRKDSLRVLLAGQEVGCLAQPLREGFGKCGCEVVSWDFDRQKNPRDVLAADSLLALLNNLPDLVLWINQPELSTVTRAAARDLGIANVLWSVD